ncbi:MAG: Mn-Zn_transporter_SitD, partial [uncultured Acidimicrobiales bacterium]
GHPVAAVRVRVLPQRRGGRHLRRSALWARRRVRGAEGHELHRPRPLARHLRRLRGQLVAGRQLPPRCRRLGGRLRPDDQRRDPASGDRRRRGHRCHHHRLVRARPRPVRRLRPRRAKLRRRPLRQHPRRVPLGRVGRHRRHRRRGAGGVPLLPSAALHHLRPGGGRGVRRAHRPHRCAVDGGARRVDPGHHAGARRDAHRGHARDPGHRRPDAHRLVQPHAPAGHGHRRVHRLRRHEPQLPPRRAVRPHHRARRSRPLRRGLRHHRPAGPAPHRRHAGARSTCRQGPADHRRV